MKKITRMAAPFLLAATLMSAPVARAAEFHGFDPEGHGGEMFPAATLAQMVRSAQAVSPPRNGEKYVFAFANLQRGSGFFASVEGSIVRNAEAAGVELVIADNKLDGATALSNADTFLRRNVDYVIEFQTDHNFGAQIMDRMDAAKVGVVAIDIPMPRSTFFGVNNPRAGFMGGAYLAQAARAKFGADAAQKGFLIIGELPQSGPVPWMRTNGQREGFLRSMPGFSEDRVILFDTKNTRDESFSQMSNILGRIPPDAPILMTAINDESTGGMVAAVKARGRADMALAVGLGGSEPEELLREGLIAASVGSFPERYGNYLIPIGLMRLAGQPLPPSVLVSHVMITPANVCEYYPEKTPQCGQNPVAFTHRFPQAEFERYLAGLPGNPILKGVEHLVPAK